MGGFGPVELGDVHVGRRRHFLPAEAHVRAEDDDRSQVEEDPAEGQDDLELHAVDVAHLHRSAGLPADPQGEGGHSLYM